MKRIWILLTVFCLAAVLSGCAEEDITDRAEPVSMGTESSQSAPEPEEPVEPELSDRIPMVMVNGALYYDTGEESTLDGRCGTYDGEITSTVEGTEIPSEDGQSNFGTGYPYQYTGEGQIDLLIDGKWMIFAQREGSGSQVRFGDRMVDAAGLSEETLQWLNWYNSLPADEQLKVSAIPPDLLTETGIAGTEDAGASAP